MHACDTRARASMLGSPQISRGSHPRRNGMALLSRGGESKRVRGFDPLWKAQFLAVRIPLPTPCRTIIPISPIGSSYRYRQRYSATTSSGMSHTCRASRRILSGTVATSGRHTRRSSSNLQSANDDVAHVDFQADHDKSLPRTSRLRCCAPRSYHARATDRGSHRT